MTFIAVPTDENIILSVDIIFPFFLYQSYFVLIIYFCILHYIQYDIKLIQNVLFMQKYN